MDTEVLIAGAGPTGLVLAIWLTRLGVKVRIIDKAAEAGTTSRALAVQARTLEFYHQVGFDDAVIAGGVKVANINFWVKGRRTARVPLDRLGEGLSPYAFALVFPQDAHERLLIEQLATLGVHVERRTELLRFDEHRGGVTATVRRSDGSEESCEAAYLAGCDGASSTVRNQLGVGFPGGTYTGLFYVADVEGRGAAVNDELHVDLEDADFVLLFPLKAKGNVRLVGTIRDLPEPEHGKLTFADVQGKAIQDLKLEITKVNWFSTYHVHHRVANRFRHGRAFLLGDAAHIHSPVGGQGMNTGIGDAVNLSWKLAEVLKKRAPEKLLDTYEPERIAFAQQLVATTDRGFTLVTRRGIIARTIRTRIVPLVVPLLFRLPFVRRLMFRTVSQIQVKYPKSALSVGEAGGVSGGDRLPWVKLDSGADNFAPLESLSWQVHVYGDPTPEVRNACEKLGLPLHVFGWQSNMKGAGFQKGAMYLVRPDGYVGLAEAAGNPEPLREYVETQLLQPE
ncbi:MAG TPA: FAD-dependent monooxygenase [Gemmatimonadaceae bacterium]|jgi:2-polyprenyl-6-methoxyphenol hydroxylase-like FAD-dependent oxidoreductase|nr:FAD-dependent monooxygenase [Gemmatimonadaceae bacterium]